MNHSAQDYINYISSVRRYSERTQEIYSEVLKDFCEFLKVEDGEPAPQRAERVLQISHKERLAEIQSGQLGYEAESGKAPARVLQGGIDG